MGRVKLPRHSRLRFGELLAEGQWEFWEVLNLPEIPEQPDDIVHQVNGTERFDLLAHRYYNDARLWWVIAVANGIEDVPTQFSVGDELRIPAPRYVTQVLFQRANVQSRG